MSDKPVPAKASGVRASAVKAGRARRRAKGPAEKIPTLLPEMTNFAPKKVPEHELSMQEPRKPKITLTRRGAAKYALMGFSETLTVTSRGRLALPQGIESVKQVEEGFPLRALKVFAAHMSVADTVVFETIGVTGGTVTRRRKESVLKPDESDRLYRLARVTEMAERVLEHPDKARTWLMSKNRALGGRTPFSLLGNEPGVAMVEDALNRIEYGVYS